MVLMGDFHQFPLVTNSLGSLYQSWELGKKKSPTCTIVQNFYSQFTTVIVLTEQMQITDVPWLQILH